MKKPNVLYVLVLLMILIFIRSIFLIYFNYTQHDASGIEGLGLLMNILIFGTAVYLLHGFTFNNPLLTILLYLMLIKPVIAIFSYLEKKYQFFPFDPTMKAHLREVEYYASNVSTLTSFLISFYILYYIFFHK
jgi:hypothetical protein